MTKKEFDIVENERTFLRITNNDIYKELKELREYNQTQSIEQKKLLSELREHVIETNGKVKKSSWIATTALTMATSTIVLLMSLK